MGIFRYKIINPVKDSKLPFYDERKGILFITNIKTNYKYYIEAVIYQEDSSVDYFLLLGKDKFDANCRLCHTDNYGRVQVKVKGQFKDFVVEECKERGNIKVEYIETIGDYDVFSVD